MLVIRERQLSVLGEGASARFEAQMVQTFLQAYPRECRQAGGSQVIAHWVHAGLQAAIAAGYRSQFEASRWLALMLILGVDFATDPQLPWVRKYLDSRRIKDPGERMALLYDETIDYLGDTAGEDAERVVRAMLRMRKVDFAAIAAPDGEAWSADCCARLHSLYPEKFEFQGAELTAQTVREFLSRASEFGLHQAGGQFLFVLLSFMLGSGFHHDPLHPWAGQVLHNGSAASRAGELEKAAREHLEQSLAAQ